MRLIDADALYDQYIDGMEKLISSTTIKDASAEALSLLLGAKLITDAPTIDAVEVVRCKDCRFYDPFDYHRKYDCSRGLLGVMGNDYCSYGERKDKRCGNCKFLTYRWGKVWCDIKCENPTVDVCDKWKRSE